MASHLDRATRARLDHEDACHIRSLAPTFWFCDDAPSGRLSYAVNDLPQALRAALCGDVYLREGGFRHVYAQTGRPGAAPRGHQVQICVYSQILRRVAHVDDPEFGAYLAAAARRDRRLQTTSTMASWVRRVTACPEAAAHWLAETSEFERPS